jgi:type I restriction enzyme R subunit
VVDKLLTGFDAPSATYLYLDRKLIDHTLFQAICRVNRLNGDRKEFGYIIDYRSLFSFIEQSIEDYTNGTTGAADTGGGQEIEGFDQAEISSLLKSRLSQAKEELQKALERVAQLSEPVRQPQALDDYFAYFCFDPKETPADEQETKIIANTPLREDFYTAIMKLSRRYAAIAMQMQEAGYSEEQSKDIYRRVKDYDELRHAIMQRSGDYVDMKMYDAQMRSLLDRYIIAPRSEKLESLDDFSFLDIININSETGEVEIDEDAAKELGGENGVAETMTANVRHVINRKREQNPEEYRKFSERIQRLLDEWRQGVIEYRQFLKGIKEMGEELRKNETGDPRLDTMAKRHLCDNLGNDVDLTMKVYTAARLYALPGFRDNPRLRKQLQKSIGQELSGTPFDVEEITQIIIAHTEEF